MMRNSFPAYTPSPLANRSPMRFRPPPCRLVLLQHPQALACLDSIPGFSQGYCFIHQGNDQAFGITGRDRCEWPHVAKNDVALNSGDITVHMHCILKSFLRMVESMQSSRPGSPDSPVIKKEIMQQCPSNQFREPFSKLQYHRNLIGVISYRNTMVGNGRIMMVQVADYFVFPGRYGGMCHRCESEIPCQKTFFFGYGRTNCFNENISPLLLIRVGSVSTSVSH